MEILRTKEIRWFTASKMEIIEAWFTMQGQTFDTTPAREDLYLVTPHTDINIKLREGKVEVKKLLPSSTLLKIGNATGFMEQWVKWGFAGEAKDFTAKELNAAGHQSWIKLTKTRMGIKINKKDGLINVYSLQAHPDTGCQIELTRIEIHHKIWYTFAVETFGDVGIDTYTQYLRKVLGETWLKQDESMSYPSFFNYYKGML